MAGDSSADFLQHGNSDSDRDDDGKDKGTDGDLQDGDGTQDLDEEQWRIEVTAVRETGSISNDAVVGLESSHLKEAERWV